MEGDGIDPERRTHSLATEGYDNAACGKLVAENHRLRNEIEALIRDAEKQGNVYPIPQIASLDDLRMILREES